MKYITILISVFIICITNAFATAQTPDYVIYEGEKYALHTNPLDAYFEKNPSKKPEMTSTANWRGYIATFSITNNSLQLKDIETEVYENDTSSTVSIKTTVFGGDEDLLIDWFSGILVLPHGELVNYVHMGYGSIYSDYILLEVKNGKLHGRKHFNSKQYEIFKNRQFEAFRKTDEYKKLIREMNERGYDRERNDEFLRSFIINYTSEFLDDSEIEVPPEENAEDKACACGRTHSALRLDGERVAVFYATKDLQAGDLLTDETIVFRWTCAEELPKHFVRMNDLFNILDSKMAFPIKEGEIVTWYHTEVPDYIKQKDPDQELQPTAKPPSASGKEQSTATEI